MLRHIPILALASTLAAASPNGGDLLWYDKPAQNWNAALPVGNGSLGGMIFGDPTKERTQLNEQTLWTGDETVMGAYQPFGDLYIDFPEHSTTSGYRRELNIVEAIHRCTYSVNGVKYLHEVFSSHPDKLMVIRITADKPASITCRIRLTVMHKAEIHAAGDTITATGSLENGLRMPPTILRLAPQPRHRPQKEHPDRHRHRQGMGNQLLGPPRRRRPRHKILKGLLAPVGKGGINL